MSRTTLPVENHWLLSEGTAAAPAFTIEYVGTLDGPPATRARVVACIINPEVLTNAASGEVVSDTVFRFRGEVELRIEDGTWQTYDVFGLTDPADGKTECPRQQRKRTPPPPTARPSPWRTSPTPPGQSPLPEQRSRRRGRLLR